MSEAEFTSYSMTIGIGGLCLLMVFIVFKLARDSKAGRFGTMILMLGLVLGVFGFLLKNVLVWWLER